MGFKLLLGITSCFQTVRLPIESILQGEVAEPGKIKLVENYKRMPYNFKRLQTLLWQFNCTAQLVSCLNSSMA